VLILNNITCSPKLSAKITIAEYPTPSRRFIPLSLRDGALMAFQDRAAGTMEIKKAANDPPQVSQLWAVKRIFGPNCPEMIPDGGKDH